MTLSRPLLLSPPLEPHDYPFTPRERSCLTAEDHAGLLESASRLVGAFELVGAVECDDEFLTGVGGVEE